MLKVSNLYGGYGETLVLQGIDLSMTPGEIVVIIGRNGVGKTTLMRAIMGLIKIKEGQILLEGVDISKLPIHIRASMGVGYVPQGRQVFPRLSVWDNLKVAARQHSKTRISEVLSEFPTLKARVQSRGQSLSGGEQQILSLARALIAKPRLLLVDEPTEGIQPSIVDVIHDKLHKLNHEDGVTVLLTEQNLDFAMELAHRALVMDKGRIVREVSPQELLRDKDVQAEYLGV